MSSSPASRTEIPGRGQPRQLAGGGEPSAAQALTNSIAATLRRLTEAAADLVFLDLPRRVAKILLGQPRGDDGVRVPGVIRGR